MSRTSRIVAYYHAQDETEASHPDHGIDAQRAVIDYYLKEHATKPHLKIADFTEITNQPVINRPVLEEARDLCISTHSDLLIALPQQLTGKSDLLCLLLKDVNLYIAACPDLPASHTQLLIMQTELIAETQRKALGRL